MNKVFSYLFGKGIAPQHIEIGSRVTFSTMLDNCVGIVKNIKGNKALVTGVYLSSKFAMWILLSDLTVVSPLV